MNPDCLGSLVVLLEDGQVLTISDVPEAEGSAWCDLLSGWLDEDIVYDLGKRVWASFNVDKVVAFEWVLYGEEKMSMLLRST